MKSGHPVPSLSVKQEPIEVAVVDSKMFYIHLLFFPQCLDAAGWVIRRASGT